MKVYLITREKADCNLQLICANYGTVLDVLNGLDGTDEKITIHFSNVVEMKKKTDK